MEKPIPEPASAVILAGGKGTRLKRDKAALIIQGKPILDLIVSRLRRVSFREIILVSGTKPRRFPLPARQVGDLIPGAGALGGIFTGLSCSGTDLNFFIACDMPFPRAGLIEYLLRTARSDPGSDCVVPVEPGGREPLFAVYRKTCLPVIEDQIRSDNLRIAPIFSRLRTREISSAEIGRLDPRRLSFFNINTPENLRKSEEIKPDD